MAVAAALLWAGAGLAKPVLPVLDGVLPFVGVHHIIPPEAALARCHELGQTVAAGLAVGVF